MCAVWASSCSGVAVKTSVLHAAPVVGMGPALHFSPLSLLRVGHLCALRLYPEVALFGGVLCWSFGPEVAPYH